MQRATRNRITSSDNNSSVEQRHAIGNQDPTISIESEDDPATECSFEYDEDGDLRSEVGDPLKRRGKDADRPTTLRGLERLSTDTEEFGEDETASGPEDVDLESFKRVYMSDLVIPEEPDKETAAFQETNQLNSEIEKNNNQEDSTIKSEGSKWKRKFKLDEKLDSKQDNSTEIVEENNNSKGGEATIDENIGDQTTGSNENKQTMNEPDKAMSLTDIERFVQVTCDQVMEKVRSDINDADDLSVRGSGIFKIRPGLRNENSTDSRASTDISTIEIPTITITEDQLDDSSVIISEATLRDGTGSEGDEIPEDGNSAQGTLKGRASSLKFKVRRFGSKVKDIFKRSTTPEVSPAPSPVGEYIDIEEEKRRRKEEEKEAEKKRKMEEIARKEEEKRRKDEAEKKRRDDELEREYERMVYEMEKKAELEAAKEIERRKKKEEKRMKEEEERLRKEEEKARKEEEKRRKAEEEKKRRDEEMEREYERMVYEMEKKAELEAAKERERQKKRDEKRRKEEERIRKMKEEEEQRRLKGEEEERRKIRENEEKRRKQAEEEERRIRQLEEEEERRRKRQEEEKEQKRLIKEESANLRETLKRKLEEGLLTGGGKDGDDGDIIKNEAGGEENGAIKSEQDEPFYMVDGKQDSRRASSPSLVSGPASVTMSKSTSLATIMVTSPASNRDKRSPSRGEETFGQTGESEGDVDPQMDGRKRKKMKKRLRDTKNKLINLKSKALESFPSISTLKIRVKEILPVRSGASGPDESGQGEMDRRYSIHREQKIFSEYRKRYPDSENEFFSDSELVESRKSTLKAISPDLEQVPGGMYDEIEISTEDRVQLLLSPINSPLRPPRRSNYGANSSFHASEPNISRTGTPKKPKRAPPPRPPPPEVDIYLLSSSGLDLSREGSTATSLGALEDIDLNSSNRDLTTPTLVRNESDRIPASIYYRNVVRDWQERHNKRIDELISASSPNLEVYQRPPRSGRPPPRIPPHPISGTHSRPQPIPRRRESRGSILRSTAS
ncbi:calponin homology domain-containing protein DDB_G0272472-like isoform X2 [Tetranychus urticae]|uniref:calponin homology domain-containing protein DDB_G0272472-like isoform X2 n=1 Tax=Tetranychus urticae TaxID=32264 RepID=UPI00077B9A6C|nr:calponin homology domain-containing protein DDB_G0272472-like isoform X2 [Tetranychus urticae]